MGYATQQDIIERYGQDQLLVLADRDGDGEVDTDVVDRALADADAEIDGYLASRYTLPLATESKLLVRLAVDVAVYHLCDDDAMVTDQRRQRYEDAVSQLKRLASGQMSLGLTPEPSTTSSAVFVGPEPRFGRGRFQP